MNYIVWISFFNMIGLGLVVYGLYFMRKGLWILNHILHGEIELLKQEDTNDHKTGK